METLESLGARLETADDIRAIVRTMKALSSASIRNFEKAVEAVAEYDRVNRMGLQIVLRREGRMALRTAAEGPGEALLVIGSDRGLCGRFNDRVAAFAADRLARHGGGETVLGVAGLRTAARLETAGHPPDRLFDLPNSVAGLPGAVRATALQFQRWFEEGRARRVSLIFNRRTGTALAEPCERDLLPLSQAFLDGLAAEPWPSRCLPMYRMDRDRLLSWLMRQRLFVGIYRALAESLASEHASRLAAMQSAERNIDERREELLTSFRRKRQETITRELLDVVAGFEATSPHGPE